MGLKKIAELRADYERKAEALTEFTHAAREFVDTHAKIREAYDNLDKLRRANRSKVEALETLAIKEFEDYKKSLVSVYSAWGPERPLPLKPLEELVARQKQAVEAAVKARVDKLAAAFPAEVKKGMLFRFEPGGELREITSEASESPNANLKGDARIWYDYTSDTGIKNVVSLETLKKSCKYIKA